MLFIDRKDRVSIKEIEDYRGNDEAILLLKETLSKIKSLGFPTRFISSKMSKGNRPGKSAVWIPFTETIKTNRGGSRTITYCEQSSGKDNDMKFEPRGINYTKTLFLNEEDIELIIYLVATCSYIKSGTIKVEDLKKESREIAIKREKGSSLTFYLYNENSPIINDDEALSTIGYALGITNASNYTNEQIRNMIFDRVTVAEQNADATYGYEWFNGAVKNTSSVENLSIIQEAQDRKVIAFNDKTFKWVIIDETGKEVKVLCPVDPAKTVLRKNYLASYFASHPDELSAIMSSVATAKEQDTYAYKNKVKEKVREDVDYSTLPRQSLIKLALANGCPKPVTFKNAELVEWLNEFREKSKPAEGAESE